MRGLCIPVFIVSLLLSAGCVSQTKYLEMEKSHVDRGEKLANLTKKYEVLIEENDQTNLKMRATEVLLQKREEELALVRQTATMVDQSWKRQISAELEEFRKEGFQINKETGGIILEESVFFTAGSATLKPEARSSLLRLASVIAKKPGRIQVIGHTDSDKVVKHAKEWPGGNIQLSGARAMQVLMFLKDEGRIDPARMSFAGCGEYQPIASNATDDGKRQNRRVEIVLKGGDMS